MNIARRQPQAWIWVKTGVESDPVCNLFRSRHYGNMVRSTVAVRADVQRCGPETLAAHSGGALRRRGCRRVQRAPKQLLPRSLSLIAGAFPHLLNHLRAGDQQPLIFELCDYVCLPSSVLYIHPPAHVNDFCYPEEICPNTRMPVRPELAKDTAAHMKPMPSTLLPFCNET